MYNINDILDTIICGSVLEELKQMPNECVDTVCCSPPYWGLRSYSTNPQVWGGDSECNHEWGDENIFETGNASVLKLNAGKGGGHGGGKAENNTGAQYTTHGAYCQLCNAWRGELGLEPTFQLYIEHLQTIFDEVYRVLKKSGTCWCNMGDSYVNNGNDNIPTKSLCNIPHRFAISMTDHNWIERNCIIWHKPSCMPSSAKDRFTVDFEYVFFFVKNKKYWFEQQFEAPTMYKPSSWDEYNKALGKSWHNHEHDQARGNTKSGRKGKVLTHPNGRNKRAVWRINPQPFSGAKIMTDYVADDGTPYTASPDCPIHGHLANHQIQQTRLGDEPLKRQSNRNTDNGNYPAQAHASEHVSTPLKSDGKKRQRNELKHTLENRAENKTHCQNGKHCADALTDNAETVSHNTYTHKSATHQVDNSDSSRRIDSRIAIEHNKQSHKNIFQIAPYGTVCVGTTYHTPDTSLTPLYCGLDLRTLGNSISVGASLNEKATSLWGQIRPHTDCISQESICAPKDINITAKCTCQKVSTDHFAVFPEKLVEPMILAGCPSEVCSSCGKPYTSIYETKKGDVIEEYKGVATKDYEAAKAQNPSDTKRRVLESMRISKTVKGHMPTCGCNTPTHPGIVLDPFVGSGTTCLVARKLGRHYIGIDLQPDYCDMARKRLSEVL